MAGFEDDYLTMQYSGSGDVTAQQSFRRMAQVRRTQQGCAAPRATRAVPPGAQSRGEREWDRDQAGEPSDQERHPRSLQRHVQHVLTEDAFANMVGLATRLQDLDLPAGGVLSRVLFFNLGVELGQLAALLLMAVEPVLTLVRQPAEVVPLAAGYVHRLIPAILPFYAFVVLRQTLQAHRRTAPSVTTIVVAMKSSVQIVHRYLPVVFTTVSS